MVSIGYVAIHDGSGGFGYVADMRLVPHLHMPLGDALGGEGTSQEAMPTEREILGFLQGFVGPQEIDDTAKLEFFIVQIRHVDSAMQEVHTILSLRDPLFFRAGEASFPS